MTRELTPDLLVAGGGLAGCFAAIAARRVAPSLDTWIVERYGFLGGMATAGYVFPFMRYFTRLPGGRRKRLVGGLFQELIDRMAARGHVTGHDPAGLYQKVDPEMLKVMLDEMVLEAGVKILFHGMANHVETTPGTGGNARVTAVHVQTKAGTYKFKPKAIVDATGDADITFHAGGPCETGRPGDGLVQPATLNFRLGNVKAFPPAPRKGIGKKVREEKARGNPLTPRDDCLSFDAGGGWVHFNQTRVAGFDLLDPVSLSGAEIEGRKQAARFIAFLKDKIPAYRRARVVGLGTQIGIRETRRITGHHLLTEDELLGCVQFDDRVALANYPIDIHDPRGSASTDLRHVPEGSWYSIPYRSLVPATLDNVIVAGRPISTTHVAHSATRVMPTCSAIGHAAGIAAGLLLQREGIVGFTRVPVADVQAILREQGAILD